MINLTQPERDIRRALIEQARRFSPDDPQGACITYKQLNQTLGLPDNGYANLNLNIPLGHVSLYEFEHGRPMLSALVVSGGTGEAGGGFARLARERIGLHIDQGHEHEFWLMQLTAVLSFWNDPDPTRAIDSALEKVVGELTVIRERLLRMESEK